MMNMEHLTPDRMNALKDGMLSGNDVISALEHIGECEQCADVFAGCYGEPEFLGLSPGFKSDIFAVIDREKRKEISGKRTAADGKRELFRYGFRVSIAASVTLLLLFTGTINHGINFSRSIQTDLPEVNVITENVRDLSDKLIDFEVTKYLKEEL